MVVEMCCMECADMGRRPQSRRLVASPREETGRALDLDG